MDYGELTLEGGTGIGLYGTPGQERFNFIWPILSQGALGVVILIDHSAEDPIKDLSNYIDTFQKMYDGRIVIGVSQVDKCSSETPPFIVIGWTKRLGVPLYPVDMRKKKTYCHWLKPSSYR